MTWVVSAEETLSYKISVSKYWSSESKGSYVSYVLGELTKHKYRFNSRYCEHNNIRIILFMLLRLGEFQCLRPFFVLFLLHDSP